MSDPNESNMVFLMTMQSLKAQRDAQMKAYINHYRVADDRSECLLKYDIEVASKEANEHSVGFKKDYVGIL